MLNFNDIVEIKSESKRWTDSSNKTYHSVILLVKDKEGNEQEFYKPFEYGYDTQYEITALNLLKRNISNYDQSLNDVKVSTLHSACQMSGIKLSCNVENVKRKKDL